MIGAGGAITWTVESGDPSRGLPFWPVYAFLALGILGLVMALAPAFEWGPWKPSRAHRRMAKALLPKLEKLQAEGHDIRNRGQHNVRSDVDRWIARVWGTLARHDANLAASFGIPHTPPEDGMLPTIFGQRQEALGAIIEELSTDPGK